MSESGKERAKRLVADHYRKKRNKLFTPDIKFHIDEMRAYGKGLEAISLWLQENLKIKLTPRLIRRNLTDRGILPQSKWERRQ